MSSKIIEESTHTPGRWVANEKHSARSNDSEIVIEQVGGSSPIAICFPINTLAPFASQAQANSRLIAAAPELLAACKSAEEWLSGWESAEPSLSIIRAAIAKATGEQP